MFVSFQKAKTTLVAVLLFLAVTLAFNVFGKDKSEQQLRVDFLNVGQGDSILLSKGHFQMLIDGGPSGKKVLAEIGKVMPYFDRKIEIVVVTHYDKDHLSGLIEVARNYEIGSIIESGNFSETELARTLREIQVNQSIEKIELYRGDTIRYQDALFTIINPDQKSPLLKASPSDNNDDSLVIHLNWWQSSFLFSADIDDKKEKELLRKNLPLKADVLKVAHHGSKYSTSEDFLKRVAPRVGVIQVGKNSYGHPASETLARLSDLGVRVARNDENGRITFTCQKSQKECKMIMER